MRNYRRTIQLALAALALAAVGIVGSSCVGAVLPSGEPTATGCAAVRYAVEAGQPADYIPTSEHTGGQPSGYWLLHSQQLIVPSAYEDGCWQAPYCVPTSEAGNAQRWNGQQLEQLHCPVPHPYLAD